MKKDNILLIAKTGNKNNELKIAYAFKFNKKLQILVSIITIQSIYDTKTSIKPLFKDFY